MREYPSLVGNRYGKLTVIEQVESSSRGQRRYRCICDCGGTIIAFAGNLKSGRTTSCGCNKSPDLSGQVFGRLTVIGRSDKRNSRGARTTPMWECRCECGNITYKATDTLTNLDLSMCSECAEKYAAEKARAGAGFVGGTQITKIVNMKPTATSSTGVRGVFYDKRSGRYRARLNYKGKLLNFGSYKTLEEAAEARRAAEQEYFGAFLEEIAHSKS